MRVSSWSGQAGLAALALAVTVALGVAACNRSYSGQATGLAAATLVQQPGWSFVPELRGVRQQSEQDCGSAALASVLRYWGVEVDRATLEEQLGGKGRSSMGELRRLTRTYGRQAFVVPGTWQDLVHEVALRRPVVIGLIQPYGKEALSHYEVVVGVHARTERVATFDPARGFRVRTRPALMKEWKPAKHVALVVL